MATPDDADACVAVLAMLPDYFTESTYDEVRGDLAHELAVVAEDGSDVIGFTRARRRYERSAEITFAAVQPDRRGLGVGTALLNRTLELLGNDGVAIVEVKTLDASAGYEPYVATRGFWERHGFVQITTTLGANELVRDQAPLLLSPNDPHALVASSPPLPEQVRASVSSDVTALLFVLGGVALVVGALGIANVTLVSVLERTGEIGVRRALGALRRHIGLQFLSESTVVGFLGGALGTTLGILIVVAVSTLKSWHPVLPVLPTVSSPLLGALVGLIAGLYPAWRASSIEPAQALQSGT